MRPEPLLISWRGRQVRVRHDDPQLSPYSPQAARLRSAAGLATDVEGLRLAVTSALGERYAVRVADDGMVVGLWKRRGHTDPGAMLRAATP